MSKRSIIAAACGAVGIIAASWLVGLTGGSSSPWLALYAPAILLIGWAGGPWVGSAIGLLCTLAILAGIFGASSSLPPAILRRDLLSLTAVALSPALITLGWMAPITRRRTAWENLEWNETLADLSQAICLSQDLETALDVACLGIDRILQAPGRAVLLYQSGEGVLRGASSLGLGSEFVPSAALSVSETDNGRCLADGRAIVCLDTTREAGPVFEHDRGACAYILAPMFSIDGFVGALYLSWPDPLTLDDQLVHRIMQYADSAGFALQRVRAEAEYQRMALTDGLTGLFNYRMLALRLPAEFARASRERTSLTYMMIDIDHFKELNDTHGHGVGDHALRELARGLRESCRVSDTIARYGGEEFVVLSPGMSLADAHSKADRLRESVEATIHQSIGLHVTVSIGVASYPETAASAEELSLQADQALYRAKESGRARVCLAIALGDIAALVLES